MKDLHFQEAELLATLERLSEHDRAAFAAACTERMLSAYTRFQVSVTEGTRANWLKF
jgi:hypothetical protein